MMSLFAQEMITKGKQEGHKEGHKEGRKEGRKEGEAALLLRLLQRRFGTVPTWANGKIANADLPTLEAWSLRFVDAQSLDEVFAVRM
ncbi:MAG: DUF4351 domain-containing protein [Magnetococcus sp. THC-1_WYH]